MRVEKCARRFEDHGGGDVVLDFELEEVMELGTSYDSVDAGFLVAVQWLAFT